MADATGARTPDDLVRVVNVSGKVPWTDRDGKAHEGEHKPFTDSYDGVSYTVDKTLIVERTIAEHLYKKSLFLAQNRRVLILEELDPKDRQKPNLVQAVDERNRLQATNKSLEQQIKDRDADIENLRQENKDLREQLKKKK